jgi:hypothetical protein
LCYSDVELVAGVVVAAIVELGHGGASEFAWPDDKRVIEQAALLQVLQQGGANGACNESASVSPYRFSLSKLRCTGDTPPFYAANPDICRRHDGSSMRNSFY